jgi:hypothetical protein
MVMIEQKIIMCWTVQLRRALLIPCASPYPGHWILSMVYNIQTQVSENATWKKELKLSVLVSL